MDGYQYRSKARMVAIIDLILSSMVLCMCLILLLGALILSSDSGAQQVNDKIPQSQSPKWLFFIIMWLMVAFTSITTIIQIAAAIKLLNATQLGKDPLGALKLCVFWRHVCFVFTGLLIFGMVIQIADPTSAFVTLFQVILRLGAIFIVTKFMKELETAVASGILPYSCPPGATPIISGVAYAYIPPPTQQQQQQQQPSVHSDYNAAPPSYYEVVKEPAPPKE